MPQWPMQCASCKTVCQEDPDTYYSLWKCRQDHYFVLCTVECQKVFEKRCNKVMDAVEKRERKINNEGQMNALRRLPPAEREKLKQKYEAEQHNWLICPFEMKVTDRCVPYCCFCMHMISGIGFKMTDGEVEVLAPPPPPGKGKTSPVLAVTAAPAELVDDDMLVMITKSEQIADEEDPLPKKKGKSKKGKEKKNILLCDWDQGGRTEADAEERHQPPARPANTVSAWTAGRPGGGGATAAEVLNPRGPTPAEPASIEREGLVKNLRDMVGCSDVRARDLLELNGWVMEQAVNAFFDDRTAEAAGPAQRGSWLRAAQQSQSQTQGVAAAAAAQQQQQRPAAEQASESQTSAPAGAAQPLPAPPLHQPPPPMPDGWKATWSEDHQDFYYWNVHDPSVATWDKPVVAPARSTTTQEDEAARAAAQQRIEEERRAAEKRLAQQREEEERRKREAEDQRRQNLVSQAMHFTGTSEVKARARLEAQNWDFEASIKMLAADQELERRRLQQQEEARRQREREAEELAAQQAAQQAALAAQAALESEETESVVFVATRHWRPKTNAETAIRVLQGELVEVVWAEPHDTTGWAYGHAVSEPDVKGYFPQSILQTPSREPQRRLVNEMYRVTANFVAPEEIAGYLTVAVGDTVEVLHTMEEPYVWAYARLATGGAGWLPENVLSES